MPTLAPSTSQVVVPGFSIVTPACSSAAMISSTRFACQSWLPSTATTRGSGGGLAVGARGGPETVHDIDLMLQPPDAERGLNLLAEAGLRTEEPPEGWLYKAFDGEVMVDLIFGPSGQPIEDALFERAEELNVNAVPMRVMALEDVFVTKLTALREHELDYESVVQMAR